MAVKTIGGIPLIELGLIVALIAVVVISALTALAPNPNSGTPAQKTVARTRLCEMVAGRIWSDFSPVVGNPGHTPDRVTYIKHCLKLEGETAANYQ